MLLEHSLFLPLSLLSPGSTPSLACIQMPCLSEAVNALLSPFFLLVTKLTTQPYSCLGG